jgi:predicted aldo/keto reductase-like oxidoreductase
MEPLLGGALAEPPQSVIDAFGSDGGAAGPVEHALRWLWDKDDVGTVLSGMSTMEQVVENVAHANAPCAAQAARCLSESDRAAYREAKSRFEAMRPVPCTTCGYCMPCPHGVDIPGNFTILNDLYMFGNERQSRWRYNSATAEDARAAACIECGECLPKCPQQIPIIDSLKRVRAELETA